MSLSHSGFSFDGSHGLIVPLQPFELPVVVGQFFGVRGESHIVGETFGRDISCDITFDGYADLEDLQADMEEIDSKIGVLTGDLTETIGGKTRTFVDCTFMGYQQSPRGPFWDGSGQNGWVIDLRLFWRQRRRANV